MKHRRMRHHLAGIIEVSEAADAATARQHIISDLKREGWDAMQPFPWDEKEYVLMGLF